MSRPASHGRSRITAALAASAAALLLLAACSGTPSTSAAAPQAGSSAGPRSFGGFGANGTPAVSGLIAAWSNGTMQVQGTTSQTAVTVTASTRITQDRSTTAKAVQIGSCVTVRDGALQPMSGASVAPTQAPTPATPASSGPITATTVVVRPAVNGSCEVGTALRSGGFTPRARPSGVPSAFSGGQFRVAFDATGQVTSVTSSGFVVRETRAGTTSSVTVVTTPSTRYTTTTSAMRSAIHTGECATAMGKSDSTGAVTAASLVLSTPVNGSCTLSGFGGGFQRNG